MTLKDACEQCVGFKEVAHILQNEMKEKAFRTDDYPSLKLKHEYLTELVNIIENETFKETTE